MEHLVAAAIEEDAADMHIMMGASSTASAASSSFAHHYDAQEDDYHYHHDSHAQDPVDDYPPSPASNYDYNSFQQPSPSATVMAVGGDGIITWQAMFQQLKDFYDLGHRRVPPRMAKWMNAQRRQYKMYGIGVKKPAGIITNRIRQLNSIGFEWNAMVDNNVPPHGLVTKKTGSPVHPRVILPPSYNPNGVRHGGRPALARKKDRYIPTNDAQVMLRNIKNRGYARGQEWTLEEDGMINYFQSRWGNKWSKIARELNNGRTDNDIKNRFHSKRRSKEQKEAGREIMMDMDGSGEEDEEEDDEDEDDEGVFVDRTGHVQSMVRAALERERQGSSATTPRSSSRRTRKPSRRVQESYNPLGANVAYNSEGEEMQLEGSRHGNSLDPSRSQGAQRLEAIQAGTKRKYFPEMLFRMVNACSVSEPDIISWVPDGTAFYINDTDRLSSVLQQYFRHNKYSSLNRMLYMYGFKKHTSGPYVDAFQHPHFTRVSTWESLIRKVTKPGESVEIPRSRATATSLTRGKKPPPASKSKRAKHPKPGRGQQGGGVPRHALFSTKPKLRGNQTVGATHPNLLFNRPETVTSLQPPTVSQVAETKDTGEPIEPTKDDIPVTLKNPKYKEVMFSQFRIVGEKIGGTDDCDMLKNVSQRIFQSFKSTMQMSGGGGRFLKKARGSGTAWYEVVDDSWALQKISNDLRRRMESSKHWLNEDESSGKAPLFDIGKESQQAIAGVVACNTKDKESDAESDADDDPMPNKNKNLIVSLKNPEYKKLMFAQFKKLGEKTEVDECDTLKVVGGEVFNMFKKDIGEEGSFFRKTRGASADEAPYELLDDDTALSKITQDLRRRMESSNNWLNVEEEEPVPDTKQEEELPVTTAKLQPVASPSKASLTLTLPDESQLLKTPKPTAALNPNWNLGSYANMGSVQYFKSDLGEGWVEQVVPRKTVRPGGPDSDKYFLKSDGKRFRSMAEVQRFLDSIDSKPKAEHEDDEDGGDDDDKDEDDASVAVDDSGEEEDSKSEVRDASFNPCMCKKSKCLKLYCECFNKEKYCSGCYCLDCRNTPRSDAKRDMAIADIKKRNPDAFKPKKKTKIECRCKRTACLKKYCDCFVHGVYCGGTCQCRGCENLHPSQLQRKHERQEEKAESNSEESGEEEEERSYNEMGEVHETWSSPADRPKKSFAVSSFAETLHDLVSFVDANDPSVISWSPGGEEFSIHDTSQEKLGPYLQKYFRHNNHASLQRQLNNYGFTRRITGSFNGTVHHPDFHRNMKSKAALSSISRRVVDADSAKESNMTSQKRSAEDEAEGRPRKTPRMNRGSEGGKPIIADGPGVTYNCVKCLKDFHFNCARTAAASFSRHVKACSPEKDTKVAETNEPRESPAKGQRGRPRRSTSPQKIKAEGSTKKQKSRAGNSPSIFKCPKCSKDFSYSFAGTAAASFAHHLRACNSKNEKAKITKNKKSPETVRGKPRKRSLSASSNELALASQKVNVENDADSISASSKKEGAVEQTALKKPTPKPTAASLPEPITPKPPPKKPSTSGKPHDDDVILSLKNQRYKQIMFAKFQTMGKRSGGEENKSLDGTKHELLSFFKQGMGDDGRFLKSDRHMNDIWEVDDGDALEKIKMDLKRRNESSKHWFKE
mmetsp:Transcript_20055/g.43485  ORF Transcript_20055/g.43485 Transcript_20055/m.43485 type:complete len:1629 (+) Transcript_20055:107-4993(+)